MRLVSSGGGGAIIGFDGEDCDPSNYEGPFYELGGAIGPLGFGRDWGYKGGDLSGIGAISWWSRYASGRQ